MMPLALAVPGEENEIKRIGGSPEVRQHLADLGFVTGGDVTLIAEVNDNVIVKVKETRVGISKELAQKIMI